LITARRRLCDMHSRPIRSSNTTRRLGQAFSPLSTPGSGRQHLLRFLKRDAFVFSWFEGIGRREGVL
jgi:hypothetical protein